MTDRLSLAVLDQVLPGVRRPSHTARSKAGPGIVHLGVGAFHRAHQAIYTDDALAAEGGDWRITGVSLRGTDIADALNPQDGLYTVLIPGSNGSSEARIIGSIAQVITARRQPDSVLAALVAPATRIVSLTVTEKAYGIDRSSGQVLPDHPNIAPDLLAPTAPSGPVGLIVEALRRRRAAGSPAFTVLCCDNLPKNGSLVRGGVLDFAARVDPGLRDWIATAVAFPSTMVDRITPSVTDATLSLAERVTGLIDLAAIETEPFTQWVIEDRFSADRPAWDAGGALFVDDVSPYETMKLRMLNGSHSLIAYAGYVAGHRYVRDVMAQPTFAPLVDAISCGSVNARAAAWDRPYRLRGGFAGALPQSSHRARDLPDRNGREREAATANSDTGRRGAGPRRGHSTVCLRRGRLGAVCPRSHGRRRSLRVARSTAGSHRSRHSKGRAPRHRQRLPNCRRYKVSFHPSARERGLEQYRRNDLGRHAPEGNAAPPWAPS